MSKCEDKEMTKKPGKWTKIPIDKRVFAFVDSLVERDKDTDEIGGGPGGQRRRGYEESRFEKWLTEKFGSKAVWNMMVYASVIFAIIFSVGIFIILPTGVVNLMKHFTQSVFWLNFTEGVFRILLFVDYVWGISLMSEIKRVFQYHGAEHKTIHCFEKRLKLIPENCRQFPTLHPRCGTSFLMFVFIIAFALHFLLGWPGLVFRVVSETAAAAGDRGDLLRAAQMGGPQRQHRGQGAEPAGALPAEGDYEGAGRQPAGSCDNRSEGSAGGGRAGERDFQQR